MQWVVHVREVALSESFQPFSSLCFPFNLFLLLVAVACITAIIAEAMSQLTINLSVGAFTGDILYAHLGVAGGVLSILSIPML